MAYGVDAQAPLDRIEAAIREAASHPLHQHNDMLWLRGIKAFIDGGMLTGSAYMRQPWGVSKIYSIDDPEYRGVRFIEPEKLYQIAKLALANDLQFTAHSQGDAAVDAMVDGLRAHQPRRLSGARPPAEHHARQLHEPAKPSRRCRRWASSPTCSRPGSTSTARRFASTSASSGSPTSTPIARSSSRA